ncbi:MAG: hypothetical protein AAFY91_07860 [Bacteroidota bacterium]
MANQNQKLTPEQIEKLQADNIRLKAELERQGGEHAEELAAVREQAASGTIPKVTTPGIFNLTIVPTNGKRKVTKEYCFADGFPKVRLKSGDIVSTVALSKVAQGTELNEEELKKSPALKDWTKAKALQFLTENAAIGVSWLVPVTAKSK